jgi:hypothetical protein
MKKTKFTQRVANARNAFFDDDSLDTNNFLSFRIDDARLQGERYKDFDSKPGVLETILKQVFLFFPGTLILYIFGLAFPIMIIESFTKRHRLISFTEIFFLACMLLAATLMTWLGLGNVRKLKHFVIPASIFSVGVLWISITGVLGAVVRYFDAAFFLNRELSICFLPLAFIAPFLAKGWVDRRWRIEKL